VFPGFLFAVVVGLMMGWVDRKVSARLQWRVGPPWYQNFVDILKLMYKEVIVPEGSGLTFILSPYFGLLSVVFVATVLGNALGSAGSGFPADLIVVLYFLMIPAIAMIIGASSSRNTFASVGASREMKLVMGYELPFLLSVIAIIIKSGGTIQLGQILAHQANHGSNIFSASGLLAFVAAVLCSQAKLGLVPFDASEAEQELMGGVCIEYSGLLLAVFKLTKAALLYTMPLFLISLFWAGGTGALAVILKYTAILVIFILIKNTNPRLKIEQALGFFWGPVTAIAAIAVALAIFGI
jgi:NADH-quinone oxidoreductase subunit H